MLQKENMKKHFVKRGLSFALGLGMLISQTACAGGGQSASASAENTSAEASDTEKAAETSGGG